MNKRWIFIIFGLFLMVFLMGNVASKDLGTFPQNSCVQLTQSCANCTQGNVSSVTYPNGTFSLLGSYPMNLTAGVLNYSFCNTSAIGSYNYITSYDENGIIAIGEHLFSITPSGEDPTMATSIFYIGLIELLLVFFLAILIYGLNTENVIGKTFSIGFGYLVLMALFFVAWQMGVNFIYSSPFLIEFLRIGFLVLVIGFFPLLIILFAYGSYMMLQIKEIQDMQKRGISIDEINERKFGAAGRY